MNNYSAQGFYTETYLNSSSDSTIIIDLQVNYVDTLVTQFSQSLFANATNATFQWYNCFNQNLLSDETNATLTPLTSGSYAVIVTQNGCIDTSACYSFITTSSINDHAESNKIWYDSQGQVLQLSAITDSRIEIYDCFGKSVRDKTINISTNEIDCSAFSNGIYFARIIMNNGEVHTYKFYK